MMFGFFDKGCKKRRRHRRRMFNQRFSIQKPCIRASFERLYIPEQTKDFPKDPKVQKIHSLLPKKDCRSCGYANCYECALAIANKNAPPDACKIIGERIKSDIETILNSPD